MSAPADEQVLEPAEFPNGAQEISPRVEALIRYHKTGGHEGSGDVTLDEAQQALSYLTRPSPVVDGLAAEMRRKADDWRRPALRQVEGPNDLKIYGGTIADDIDRWADAVETLAMRPAPETASDDVVLREALNTAYAWALDDIVRHPGEVELHHQRRAIIRAALANLPKPTEQANSPAPDAVLRGLLQEARDHGLVHVPNGDPDARTAFNSLLDRIDAALASPASTAEGEASIRARTEEKGHG